MFKKLQYKPIEKFKNKTMKENLNFFLKNYEQPLKSTFYAKVIQFENDNILISLNLYILIDDDTNDILDNFAVISHPFQIRNQTDINILNSLYEIFESDIETIEKEVQSKYGVA